MELEPQLSKSRVAVGRCVFALGWVINLLSLWFGLESFKVRDPPYLVHWLVCVAVLVLVSAAYIIARGLEPVASKTVRSYLSPYLVGATCWVGFFLFIFIVGRLAT